ncbi:hypothetical protein DMB66_18850 [Actinoplanes sp. ATCC 53533]|uniref:hypothetical protein n=1 Tax=Actinoplanes sp. ATCC 53533 TaxID=1288362 RepID=UPI000F7AABC6|nr:hypothetical protein [Actinoplanes sp. ATCC 53533]RSM64707.1 hypothetical protein DMB66_18850 [Actinoplanes sp. ATCC 53533]
MNWPFAAPETAATLTGITVLIMAASFIVGRRHRSQQRQVIAEALESMAEHLAAGLTTTAQEQRRLAVALVDQHRLAARVDEDVRPYVISGPAKPGTLPPATGRPIDHVAAAVDDLRAIAQRRGDAGATPPVRGSALGPVPGLQDSPELREVYEAMLTTLTDRIRQANAVVLMAVTLGAGDAKTRARIADALRTADTGRQDSETLAGKGRLVSAVHRLAHTDTPVPESGVPGEATRQDVRRQSSTLREIVAGHEAELLGWLIDARTRCAPEKGGTAA